VGDVRDKLVDKSSFPKLFGNLISYSMSFLLLILVMLLVANLEIIFPLLIMALSMIIFREKAYTIHRVFVFASSVFYLNIVSSLMGAPIFINNLIFLAFILNLLYPIVPRNSTPQYM
jgi:hypothetical protein